MKETIVITSNAYFPNIGGVENSLKYLAESYINLGYNVIIAISDVSNKNHILPHKEIIDNVTIYRYNSYSQTKYAHKYFKGIRALFNAYALLKYIKQNNNVILTISRFHTTTVLAKLCKLSNVIYLVPGVVINQNNNKNLISNTGLAKIKLNISKILHHNIQKMALKYSDQVIVFSENMSTQISQIIPSLKHIPIVKPGVDPERFIPVQNKISLKEKFSIPTDKIILLTVGRFVKAKGFEMVIDALLNLPKCHLVMVGDGENYTSIKQQITNNKLEDKITLTGPQSDTAPYYQLADIFVMSSTYEPLGQTILEALSTGLPIVAFKGSKITTATQELLSEKEALYTDSVNEAGITKCIRLLIDEPSLRNSMSNNSRRIAIDRFSWNKLGAQILKYKKK
ncbi:glycosyltransferase family 4 protein [Colwellia sp. RE-S-Sl-9]